MGNLAYKEKYKANKSLRTHDMKEHNKSGHHLYTNKIQAL